MKVDYKKLMGKKSLRRSKQIIFDHYVTDIRIPHVEPKRNDRSYNIIQIRL